MCLEQSASHWLPSFVNWDSLGGTLSLILNLSKRNSNYTSAQPHTLVGSEDSISKITQPLTFMIMLLHHQENGHTYGLWPLRREQYHRRKISVEWNKHRNKPMRARAHTHTHTHTHTVLEWPILIVGTSYWTKMKGIIKVHDHYHHVGKAGMLSTTISFFCSLRTIS